MIKKFFKSKIFLFFMFMLLTGFFLGYDYAVITSKEPAAASFKAPETVSDVNSNTPDVSSDMFEQDANSSEP